MCSVARGSRVGRSAPSASMSCMVDGGVAVGDDVDVDAFLGGLGVDLVVHVRDVAGVDHGLLAVETAQHPEQHVEHHHRAGIADVGVVVDGRPAHIHRHPLRIGRLEGLLLARQGVVQLEGHGMFGARPCGVGRLPWIAALSHISVRRAFRKPGGVARSRTRAHGRLRQDRTAATRCLGAKPRPSREAGDGGRAHADRLGRRRSRREGVIDTPERVVDAYGEWFEGYGLDPARISCRAPSRTCRATTTWSCCATSRWRATASTTWRRSWARPGVAYLPDRKVAGLSKLARVVEIFARRLQTQETLTRQIADAIEQRCSPTGVAILIDAEHQCMTHARRAPPPRLDRHHPVHRRLQDRQSPAGTVRGVLQGELSENLVLLLRRSAAAQDEVFELGAEAKLAFILSLSPRALADEGGPSATADP